MPDSHFVPPAQQAAADLLKYPEPELDEATRALIAVSGLGVEWKPTMHVWIVHHPKNGTKWVNVPANTVTLDAWRAALAAIYDKLGQ